MLRLHLLGGLNITLADDPVTGFVSGKTQALACYLAITRQPHLRANLAAMFWGDMPDEDASTNLRQAIANLKKLLEPYFEITRQSIAFNTAAPYWSDVETFTTSRDPTLYRGDLLAGFSLPDAPAFEEWLTAEREHLHEMAIHVLREEAARTLTEGDDESAIRALNRLIALDPLQESAHRQLMLAFALSGQRSAALKQYETCKGVLQRELGIEPEAETSQLYQRIRTIERLVHLPSETTPFVGRDIELAELMRRLNDPTCHLITIVGLGGIGKTRLALRFAHQACRRMLHGAVMVNLTSVMTLESLISTLADALHFTLAHDLSPSRQILNFLREKQLLLVLDNFEQLIDTCADFVGDLLRAAPEIKVVVTSRERLNLRGEWSLALHGLPTQPREGSDAPALALFWETARRVRGDNLIGQESLPSVERICQLLDGMPLAIELAAAWSRLLSCDELADEIASNMTALESTTRDHEPRHQSLRAVFDHSWHLFSAQEQRVLMALSAFPAGFTREGAEKVAGASMPMLLGLTDKMLVQRDSDGSFSLHEMTRQYLAERLIDSGEAETVWTAFIDYYVAFLKAREPRLKTAEQQRALAEISADLENIHVTWAMAIARRDQAALSGMMTALSLFHDMKATWRLGKAIFLEARAAIEPEDCPLFGEWSSHIALFCSRIDNVEDAERFARQGLESLSLDNSAHRDAASRLLVVLGNLMDTRGSFRESQPYYWKALELRQSIGDNWGCANCYVSLAGANGRLGSFDEARSLAERGLAISQQMGDLWLTTRLNTVLALVAANLGDLGRAEQLHRANLDIFESIDSLEGRALSYSGLGVVASYRHDLKAARAHFSTALEMFRQLGSQLWEADELFNLAEIAKEMGDLPAALDQYQQSLEGFRALNYDYGIRAAEGRIAEIQLALDEQNRP